MKWTTQHSFFRDFVLYVRATVRAVYLATSQFILEKPPGCQNDAKRGMLERPIQLAKQYQILPMRELEHHIRAQNIKNRGHGTSKDVHGCM